MDKGYLNNLILLVSLTIIIFGLCTNSALPCDGHLVF